MTDLKTEFKTPLSKLVKFFQQSRNQWKVKAIKRAEKIKLLETKVKDLQESRERWKTRAQMRKLKC